MESLNLVFRGLKLDNRHDALLVVDAAPSAGCIPIDIRQADPDILIFTGHKWLYGYPGIGGLYIRDG